MSKIKLFLQQSWLLIVASFLFGLLIAMTNAAWSPIIEKNKIEKLNGLIKGLLSDANSFEVVIEGLEIPTGKGRLTKTDIYRAINDQGAIAGFAFIAKGSGFAGPIELVIAVDPQCENFFGFKVLACIETPGFGDGIKKADFAEQFSGIAAAKLELIKIGKASGNKVVAISGATVSSTAVVNIFNSYIDVVREELKRKGFIK